MYYAPWFSLLERGEGVGWRVSHFRKALEVALFMIKLSKMFLSFSQELLVSPDPPVPSMHFFPKPTAASGPRLEGSRTVSALGYWTGNALGAGICLVGIENALTVVG